MATFNAKFEHIDFRPSSSTIGDERWTFGDDGHIQREVAPQDDERYTNSYLLDGGAWRRD